MQTTTTKLNKAFYGDYCEWEHQITASISPSLAAKIDAMHRSRNRICTFD